MKLWRLIVLKLIKLYRWHFRRLWKVFKTMNMDGKTSTWIKQVKLHWRQLTNFCVGNNKFLRLRDASFLIKRDTIHVPVMRVQVKSLKPRSHITFGEKTSWEKPNRMFKQLVWRVDNKFQSTSQYIWIEALWIKNAI